MKNWGSALLIGTAIASLLLGLSWAASAAWNSLPEWSGPSLSSDGDRLCWERRIPCEPPPEFINCTEIRAYCVQLTDNLDKE